MGSSFWLHSNNTLCGLQWHRDFLLRVKGRIVSWFSCGAASAVATKLAISTGVKVEIYYCEIAEEHPDNKRFIKECEEWFGQRVQVVGNDKYNRSIDEVFHRTRYLVGPFGARCTSELKRSVRKRYGLPSDIVIFGYTKDEENRITRLIDAEPDINLWPIILEKNLTKPDCLALLKRAGITIPVMYRLGYKNNNCIGCVKGQAGYWNKIRIDFPERFDEMARIERELGRTICKIEWRENGKRLLKRIYLDELPESTGRYNKEKESQCGIFCQLAENGYS